MKIFGNKKSGFTLMEIALAILIVAILALLCVPVIHRQLTKTDEYSYYMAYKTVEKMGGQIAALGDAYDEDYISQDTSKPDNKIKIAFTKFVQNSRLFIATTCNKLVYSEAYLFSHLFPKSLAATTSETLFDAESYNMYKLYFQYCKGLHVTDPDGKQDLVYKECDANGKNCVSKKKCTEDGGHCCDDTYLNLSDVPGCNANWSFQQKYVKTTTTKEKTSCEKKADGTKLDPNCKEQEVEKSEEETVTSCTPKSTSTETITCKEANKLEEAKVAHILRDKDVKEKLAQYQADSDGGAQIPECNQSASIGGTTYTWQQYKENTVSSFFPSNNCNHGSGTVADDGSVTVNSAGLDGDIGSLLASLEGPMTANNFCTTYANKYCTTDLKDEGYTYTVAYSSNNCVLKKAKSNTNTNYNNNNDSWTISKVTDTCTSDYGYYNMRNIGGDYNLVCGCSANYTVKSQNNDKVCCKNAGTKKAYAKNSPTSGDGACVYCDTDFNPNTDSCCPEYSSYNGSECVCANGYVMKDGKCEIDPEGCASGTRYDEDSKSCIANPAIVSGQHFCKTIVDYWNTSSSSCSAGFTEDNGFNYNDNAFQAAIGENDVFLSINAKEGAFKSITPNVTMVNGLKLWILSDKYASIPGLSYSPIEITATQNVCKNLKKTTSTACTGAGGTFCGAENHCFSLDSDSYAKMGDARNCCKVPDFSAIASVENADKDNRMIAISGFTVFVDINGDKGSGTLWEDVFPFFVGSNGMVYPGYPLDATKDTDKKSSLYLGGNSVSNLSVDVYYYDVDSAGKNRKRVIAYPAVSYARGACYGKLLNKYTPYCLNLGNLYQDVNAEDSTDLDTRDLDEQIDDDKNPCNDHKCFLGVRKKLRFF